MQVHPGHVRHHHIAQNDIETLIGREQIASLRTGGSFDNLMLAKNALERTSDGRFVIDHQ